MKFKPGDRVYYISTSYFPHQEKVYATVLSIDEANSIYRSRGSPVDATEIQHHNPAAVFATWSGVGWMPEWEVYLDKVSPKKARLPEWL